MEKKLTVQLKTIADVKQFNQAAFEAACDIEIHSGRHIVDAKSLMGIFSLDISKPMDIYIGATENSSDFDKIVADFTNKIKALVVG
jgi:phosphotransferase system HPr-like phosphotransfer protein